MIIKSQRALHQSRSNRKTLTATIVAGLVIALSGCGGSGGGQSGVVEGFDNLSAADKSLLVAAVEAESFDAVAKAEKGWLYSYFLQLLSAKRSAPETYWQLVSAPARADCAAANVHCVSVTAGATQEYGTLQAAANAVLPGDTVRVFPGSYAGFTIYRSGTSTQPIRFVASEAGVVIDRGGSSDSDGIRLQNASHVAVEDLVIRNADSSSPRINGCINARGATEDSPMRGNVLRNDRCIDSDAEGFYVSQFHTGLIEGNVISGAGKTGRSRAHGIYLANAGSDGTVIRGNTTSNITSPQSEGLHCNGDMSVGGDGLITDLVIEANRIPSSGGNNALNFDGVQRALTQNNLAKASGRHAL